MAPMVTEARNVMSSWLGSLATGGVIDGPGEDALAAFVVGEDRVGELRGWLAAQTEQVRLRERRAAIEVCIWMAHVDRHVDAEEAAMLRELIGRSGLSDDEQDALVAATHDPPSLATLEERLTHPVLRELLLALAWELASADGRIDRRERDFYAGIGKRLEVPPARAAEIQRAIAERVG
jgi:tellurite resistance protein